MSRDSVKSHQKFKQKYSLPFPLLADVDGKLYQAFDTNSRSTFLFDADGKCVRVWPKVSVGGHAEDVLAAIG